MSEQGWTRFGSADLTNCEREQIHFSGSVQPHGALLVLEGDDRVVRYASANVERFTGIPLGRIIGMPLHEISPSTVSAIGRLDRVMLQSIPHAVPFVTGDRPEGTLLAQVHESPDDRFILEVEETVEESIDRELIADQVDRLLELGTFDALFDATASLVRDLTGYDRVMVYRFDDDGHGAVVAEEKREGLESFFGNHYPASDIPQIARQLYVKNRTRVLADVDYEPVPLRDPGPVDATAVDMSIAQLRSMSPIHLQYLRNMGVSATLVASLVVDGQLWGLIACHHYRPKRPGPTMRAACELIAEVMSTKIVALDRAAQTSIELLVRRFEQRLVESIAKTGEWTHALTDRDRTLLECVNATGVALMHDGEVYTIGDVPSTADIREIVAWLEREEFDQVFATQRLARESRFEHLKGNAAGVLAARISPAPRELLLWFRPEQVRLVTWGGDPRKPAELASNDPAVLSPRRSFESWHQLVERTSAPWTKGQRTVARAVSASIADVVLQFRSVRLVMAHQRISETLGHVEDAVAPLFIAGADGRCVVANRAFRDLVRGIDVSSVEELGALFGETPGLDRLVSRGPIPAQPWRGKVEIELPDGSRHPVLLRADPIVQRAGQLIGTVFLFIDLVGRREVESARLRFRQAVAEQRARHVPPTDEPREGSAHLFDRILDNANLAAIEVVAGLDVEAIPPALRSIEVSFTRATDLLDQLVGFEAEVEEKGDD